MGYDAMANAFWMEGKSEEALRWQLKSHELEPYKSADKIARFYRSMNEYGKAMEWLLESYSTGSVRIQILYMQKVKYFMNLIFSIQ